MQQNTFVQAVYPSLFAWNIDFPGHIPELVIELTVGFPLKLNCVDYLRIIMNIEVM